MRTLKRTLCLVLVLVMMVGLLAVGASAVKLDDYKDKDAIQNKEAVAVLSAIGVLEGDANGFRPGDFLTRAEGAKIMAVMHNTQGTGVSSFSDMGAAAWAQPFVAYCEQNGIIAGMGDGTFHPQDQLTGAAFAKMLLCALGYDASLEGLIGTAWEINVVKLVNKLNLAAGITAIDWSAPITRDNAAQLAFNTLKATMVEYNGNVKVTTGDGTKVEVGANAQPIGNNAYDYRNEVFGGEEIAYFAALLGRDVNTMQFCESYFPTLKLKTGEEDDFGMPQRIWYKGDTRVDPIVSKAKTIISALAGTIMATYDKNMAVSEKQVYTDGNLNETEGYNSQDNNELIVIENGEKLGGYYQFYKDGTSLPFLGLGKNEYSKALAGATVYLLDTDDANEVGYGIADTLIVKYPYLAKVSAINAATPAKDRNVELTVYTAELGFQSSDPGYTGRYTTCTLTYETEDFAKGDFVLVYPNCELGDLDEYAEYPTIAAPAVIEAVKADSANGTLTQTTVKFGSTTALTVGGVSYPVGAVGLANLGPTVGKVNYVVGTEAANYTLRLGNTVYLSNGYVLGVVGDSVTYGNYVFLLKSADAGTTISSGYKTGFAKQDASLVEVSTTNVGTKVDPDDTVKVWGTAVEATGGMYTITPAAAKTYVGSTAEISPKSPTIAVNGLPWNQYNPAHPEILGGTSIVADAKTAFIVFNGVTYTAYSGISNVPNFKEKSADKPIEVRALIPSDGAHAAAIYVNLNGAEEVNANTKTIFLVNGATYSSKSVDGATDLYNFTAIVDGELKEIPSVNDTIYGDQEEPISGLIVPKYNAKNYLLSEGTTLATGVNGVYVSKTGEYKLEVSGGIVSIVSENGATSAVLADGATAYVYNYITGVLSIKDPADITGWEGMVSLEPVSSRDPSIKAIYLVQY